MREACAKGERQEGERGEEREERAKAGLVEKACAESDEREARKKSGPG